MAIQSLNKTYDECQQPVCDTDPRIRVLDYSSKVCSNAKIHWTIDNIEGETLTITDNKIVWSVNDQNFKNSSSGSYASIGGETQTYYEGTINTDSGDVGVIYFKIRVQINGVWFENEEGILVITLVDCDVFFYDCLAGSEWSVDSDTGAQTAKYYIEYTTDNIRDEIKVVTEYSDSNPCVYEREIWDSGCVGTYYGEGPGVAVGSSSQYISGNNYVKGDCFVVDRLDLSLGIIVNPSCDGDNNSTWQVAIKGPTSNWYYASGGDASVCETIPGPSRGGCTNELYAISNIVCCSSPATGIVGPVLPGESNSIDNVSYDVVEEQTGTVFENSCSITNVHYILPIKPLVGTWYTFIRSNSIWTIQISPSQSGEDDASIRSLSGAINYNSKESTKDGDAMTIVYDGDDWISISEKGEWIEISNLLFYSLAPSTIGPIFRL
jgi:hypothetical protein